MIQWHDNLQAFLLQGFSTTTLQLESQVLRSNPLGDAATRLIPVLAPKGYKETKELPLVVVLAGFTGNGPKYFNTKGYELNFPQLLDECWSRGAAPQAVYAFIDGWSFWGGSQFINSEGTGRYEDFIVDEVLPALEEHFPISADPKHRCVTGGSSGGYGALHLVSQRPDKFGLAAAIAPDSFFDASLLPDIYTAMPLIQKMGGVQGVKVELQKGKLLRRRESHSVLNAIGMGFCYCPDGRGGVRFPIDEETGALQPDIWNQWKMHDPLVFLNERKDKLAQVEGFYLDVGDRDQFHLQYGTRQIRDVLYNLKASVTYNEFEGNHFDIGERRPQVWAWLKEKWQS